MSPDTLAVRDGHADGGTYVLEYAIDNPERVTTAYVQIYAPGIGDVSPRVEVPVVSEGRALVSINPARYDFGPSVLVRAVCPEGTTTWFPIGAEPLPYEQRQSAALAIGLVSPQYIRQSSPDFQSGAAAVRITMESRAITSACTADMTVNGQSVELRNPLPMHGRIEGLLLYRDIANRAVSARYLELKLVLKGPQIGIEAIKHVTFAE